LKKKPPQAPENQEISSLSEEEQDKQQCIKILRKCFLQEKTSDEADEIDPEYLTKLIFIVEEIVETYIPGL
jgi:hypothetical protein